MWEDCKTCSVVPTSAGSCLADSFTEWCRVQSVCSAQLINLSKLFSKYFRDSELFSLSEYSDVGGLCTIQEIKNTRDNINYFLLPPLVHYLGFYLFVFQKTVQLYSAVQGTKFDLLFCQRVVITSSSPAVVDLVSLHVYLAQLTG